MDRCISLIKKNLALDITVITNEQTLSAWPNKENCNTIVMEQEVGNRRDRQDWYNLDRCHAYDLSPYDKTLLLDIDYFCYTDNLLQYLESDYDFLISNSIHDLTGRDLYKFSTNSVIPMVWATVIVFKKSAKARSIFDMVKHIKSNYQYFCELYRIDFKNFRNDYAFAMALNQIDADSNQNFFPAKLPTLPVDAKILSFQDTGIDCQFNGKVMYIRDQDAHVLNKEIANV
jgi:hypothetical protein